jgi:hypothetical protein
MLHAWQLGFSHPRDGRAMLFTSPVPEDFRDLGVKVERPVE